MMNGYPVHYISSMTIFLNCLPLSSKSVNMSKLAHAGERRTISPLTAILRDICTASFRSAAINVSVKFPRAFFIFSRASPIRTRAFTLSLTRLLRTMKYPQGIPYGLYGTACKESHGRGGHGVLQVMDSLDLYIFSIYKQ